MYQFRDIHGAFHEAHPFQCPCRYSVSDFVNHEPLQLSRERNPHSDSADHVFLKILLLDKIPEQSSVKNFDEILKAHFLILGTKFHPDGNSPHLKEKCVEIMGIVNKAYFNVMGSLNHGVNKKVVKKDNAVYSYVDENNITGSFLNCFTVYSHPTLSQVWVELLGGNLKVKAVRLSGGKGVQFGSIDQAKYITVYDNGTILSQGVMGLHYGIDVIAKGLVNEVQRRALHVECDKKKRSGKFKESLKMFNIEENGDMSPESHSVAQKTFQTDNCSSCRDVISDLKHQLQTAVTTIGQLKEEISQLKKAIVPQQSSREPLPNSDKDLLRQICDRLEVIETDQKQIKTTFGAQIASAIRNTQRNAGEALGTQNEQKSSGNQRGWESTPRAATPPSEMKKPQPTGNNRKFVPENTLVIYDFKEQAKTDREIRQLVNKTSGQAVVQNISRSGERNPKYLVQFASTAMKEEVLSKWDENNLGSSKVRNTTKDQKSIVGFAKHVPVEIEDEELAELVESQYPGSKAVRVKKSEKSLETIKIFFASETQREGACAVGLPLDDYHYRAPITPENPRVIYTQCFRCWKYGHIAKVCNNPQTCRDCGEGHPLDTCPNDENCCPNCGDVHKANEWAKCSVFERYKQKCIVRFNRRNGSD